ncbi:metallophosphoesterase [Methanobacterium petrolearium]|uniref:metallophosphoesterase n=1 Tax=Methanobacterium petrolearium TaxID=710190 RepID=UPI001FD77FC7|nr:metallophosphoesterase [Methanobacterium petrolearium]MBP1946262.1 serine/threonine-protein phosphatase PP1 catalytic subunit [Methanobacterium petrolearium]
MIKLPREGVALIVTDLHGNVQDFRKIIEIWENLSINNNHLILTGDFIHAMSSKNDHSLEILKAVRVYCQFDNFHLLLGNHEWATITHRTVYKGGENQSVNFKVLLKNEFGGSWKNKFEEYVNFLKTLPVAVKTDNGVFISHSGPPKGVNSIREIMNLTERGYSDNPLLFELLWNRYGDYTKNDVDNFLEKVGCKAMIVGHTPVDGYKLIQNQLIVSSSFSKGKKAYVELDLEKEIKGGRDLKRMVKYFK